MGKAPLAQSGCVHSRAVACITSDNSMLSESLGTVVDRVRWYYFRALLIKMSLKTNEGVADDGDTAELLRGVCHGVISELE